MYKQGRDVLQETRKIGEYDIEKFGTLGRSEKTIAILGEMVATHGETGRGDDM